jgi:hypothetical protein
MRFIVLALLSLLLSACGTVSPDAAMRAVRVDALNPRPRVDLDSSKRTLSLKIDSSIPDAFTVPQNQGVTAVPVSQWHQSLTNGFDNGPGKFFQRANKKDDVTDYQLSLVDVTLDYVPTAVFTRGVNTLGAASVVARIRYIARLTNRAGVVVARTQGEVFSQSQWTGPGGSSMTSTEAIESMYAEISRKLLPKVN